MLARPDVCTAALLLALIGTTTASAHAKGTRSPARRPPPRVSLELAPGVSMDFVLVPAGTFVMGSPTDEPGHNDNEAPRTTTIAHPLYVATTEVTQAQYRSLMGHNPTEQEHRYADPRNVGADMPVVGVGYEHAVAFCQALGARTGRKTRLPTEAEWEHTCRAQGAGPFGDVPASQLNEHAVFGKPARLSDPVGKKKPDALGLFDLRGNVWEWTSDWFAPYDPATTVDPTGPATPTRERVFRGGCSFNKAELQRCAFRHTVTPGYKDAAIGFRVVMDVD